VLARDPALKCGARKIMPCLRHWSFVFSLHFFRLAVEQGRYFARSKITQRYVLRFRPPPLGGIGVAGVRMVFARPRMGRERR